MSNTNMQAVPSDHPLMRAWEQIKASAEYANALKWAADEQHREGSLWALFEAGWTAANLEVRDPAQAKLQFDKIELKDGDVVQVTAPEGTPQAVVARQCQDFVNYCGEYGDKRVIVIAPQVAGFSIEKIPDEALRKFGLRRVSPRAVMESMKALLLAAGLNEADMDAAVDEIEREENESRQAFHAALETAPAPAPADHGTMVEGAIEAFAKPAEAREGVEQGA